MMIRSFTNSKSEAFYVVGFSSLDERHRMFTALTESTVFLHLIDGGHFLHCLTDCREVGQHTTRPSFSHERHVDIRNFFSNNVLSLFFCCNKQNSST